MLLQARGIIVTEDDLVRAVNLQPGGVNPEELRLLARHYGLLASEQQVDLPRLRSLVADQRFPIVFLHRRPLDQEDAVHAVIPIHFSKLYVNLLDPLKGSRRVTVRKFERARQLVGGWTVVW